MLPRDRIARAIRVGMLQTRMAQATVYEPDELAIHARRELLAGNFDHAPLVEDRGGGRVVGLVVRDRLDDSATRRLRERARPATPELFVSADATLDAALPWLVAEPFLFVLDGREITGFVTPADLNKHPGRTYFYLLVADLELGVSELIREHHRDLDAVLDLLPRQRRNAVRARVRRDREQDVDTDPVAAAFFGDLLDVVGGTPPALAALGVDEDRWAALVDGVNDLRRDVMHPARPLLTGQRPVAALVTLDERLREALRRLEPAVGVDGR